MNIHRAMTLFACTLAFILSACANKPQKVDEPEIGNDIKNGLVVRDFLVAISQVHAPEDTTVQLNAPTSEFGRELERGFIELGFGIQRVTSDQGKQFLSYTKSTTENSNSVATDRYKIFVGDSGFERTYAGIPGGGIAPIGPMMIYGSNTDVKLNDQLFPGQSVEVSYADDEVIKIDPNVLTVIDANVMNAISELRQGELPEYRSLNFRNQEIQNLFNGPSSNFEEVNDVYRTVRKDVIIFDNDSLVLKRKGRDQIARLIKFYDPQSDVFRLIGCSLGPTQVAGGNEELALGRSARVAEELVSREVELSSILDEGCWAPSAGNLPAEDYPRRAVVVELQRKG